MKRFLPLSLFPKGGSNGKILFPISVLFVFFVSIGARAQVAGYTFSQQTGTYDSLVTPTVLATASGVSGSASLDNVIYDIPSGSFPFAFNFNGELFTGCKVSTNGFITFGTTAPGGSTYTPISSTTGYRGAISAFGVDLNAVYQSSGMAGQVLWGVTGTAPNREIVFEWKNFRPYYSSSATNIYRINIQIRLQETSNQVKIVYGPSGIVSGSPTFSTSVQVGLRGTGSSDYNNRRSTTDWNSTTAGTGSSSSVSISASNLPANGLTFIWDMPPVCTAPSAQPTALSLTPASASVAGSFTAAVPAADRYLVVRTNGSVPTNPVDGIIYATGAGLGGNIDYAGTATSFTSSGLSGNTSYSYYVYAYNANACMPAYNTSSPLVMSAVTCPAVPGSLSAASVTNASAVLSWSSTLGGGASPVTYILEVASDNGFTSPVAGSPFTVADPTLSQAVSGLSSSTTYYYRVKADNGCSSAYSSTASFITACDAIVAPTASAEGFGTMPPLCWQIAEGLLGTTTTLSPSSQWISDDFANITSPSNPSAKINIYGTSRDGWLITPSYDLGVSSNFQLEFDLAFTDYAGTSSATMGPDDKFVVVISTDNGNTWTDANALRTWTDATPISNVGEHVVIDLSAYTGLVKIGFYGESTVGSNGDNDLFVDNVAVNVIPSCQKPLALTADSIGGAGARLSWTPGGTETLWNIEWGPAGFSQGSGTVVNGISTNPYLLNGLNPTTTYAYYVQADCGSDQSDWLGPFTFMTEQIPVSVFPYTEDFESGLNNWETSQAGQTNQWFVGTAVNNGGTQAAYVSNDNGVTNAYTISGASSVSHLYRDIQIPAGFPIINLSFDWRNQGENNYDYLRVWLVPISYTPTAGSQIYSTGSAPSGRIQLGGNFQLDNTFKTETFTLPMAYAGETFRLVFEWRNDGGTGAQPPAAIDNVNISISACVPPTALTLDSAGNTGVKLAWTENGSASSWNIEWGPAGFTQGTGTVINGVSSNPYLLSGLSGSTQYSFYVQSDCGTDQSSWAGPYTFMTAQVPLAVFPYTEDFESGLNNWGTIQAGQTNQWAVGNAVNNGGTQAAYISNDNGVSNAYTISSASSVSHLYRDIQIPAGFPAIDLSFDWKNDGENNYDYLRVWLVPVTYTPVAGTQITAAGNAPSGQVQLGGNFQDITAFQSEHFIIPSAYSGETFRLVFEWRNDGGTGTQPPAAIDNIQITIASCQQPAALNADSITPGAARLSWTDPGNTGLWNIEYGPVGFTPGAGTAVNGVTVKPYVLTGLTPATDYSYYIQSDCGSDSSLWSGPFNFSTPCQPDSFVSLSPVTRCGTGTATLGAVPTGAATAVWYDAATGGNALGMGNSFVTPVISADTVFYAEPQTSLGAAQDVGPDTNQTAISYYINNWGITFDAASVCRINSVAVYPGSEGTITIAVQSGMTNPVIFGTKTYTFSAAQVGTKVIIPMNILVPAAGTGYKMLIRSSSAGFTGLHRDGNSVSFPYSTAGVPVTLTSSQTTVTSTSSYYFFYDWSVEEVCVGAREAVGVTVTPAPAIMLSISDSTICEGSSSVVTAASTNAGYKYTWMPGSLNGASQTLSPAQSTRYIVTATDTSSGANAGCAVIDTIEVIVKGAPVTPSVTPAAPQLCLGNGTQMLNVIPIPQTSAVSGTGTSETSGNSTSGSLGPNPMQTYYGGSKQQMLFLASELQTMGVVAGVPINSLSVDMAQANSSYTLQNLRVKMAHTTLNTLTTAFVPGLATVRTPASYVPSVGENVITFDTPFTWNGRDNIVVEINYTNANSGGSSPYSRAYYSTTSFQSSSFYRGDNVAVGTIDTISVAGYTYTRRNNVKFGLDMQSAFQWSPATDLYTDAATTLAYSGTDEDTVYFAGASTQTYSVTHTAYGCVSAPQTVTVTVNPLPLVSAGNDTAVCAGSQLTLSGAGADSYSWNNGVSDGVAFSPSATTTYTVTGTDANNCSASDSLVVTVNAVPTISAGTDTAICMGATLSLTAVSSESGVSWNNGISDGVAFTPSATTVYTASVTGANNCSASDSVTVTVHALPLVNAGADTAVCAGSQLTLSGAGADSYSWNNGVSDGVAFSPSATTTYTVTGTDVNNCSATDSVLVTIHALPVVDAGADTAICAGSQVTLNGSGADFYSWNNGVSDGLSFEPGMTLTYTVIGVDGNNCSAADSVTVTVNPNPVIDLGSDITTVNASETLTAPAGYASYQWSTGETTPSVTVSSSGTYSVVVTDANGCTGSDSIVFITTFSVENNDGSFGLLSIYPNPSQDIFNIRMEGVQWSEVDLEVLSVSGKMVMRNVLYPSGGSLMHTIDLGNYSEGVYLVRFRAGKQTKVHRIVLSR